MDRRTALSALALGGLSLTGCGGPPGPITRAPSWAKFAHPETEQDLIELVREARRRKAQLRVRGSMHSVGAAIFTDKDGQNLNVHLDRYNRILCWDEAAMEVTVQAGIHLGIDPLDETTTWENSLNMQLQERGWALPSLGGITHQTVGGFLSTGSAGGSLRHDVASSVVKLRIVAGDGNVYELAPNPGDPNDGDVNPFYAAGVAMGLFGILSAVTFRCIPSYKVKGDVVTCSVRDPGAPADPYAAGPRGLEQWFEAQEYNRTLIWPQKGIEKIEFWRAERMKTGPGFRPKPYVQLAETLQKVASVIYRTVDAKPPPYDDATYETMRAAINTFVTDGSEQFWDHWYRGLPIDNTISDLWMPTEFTDLFVDIRHTTKLMRTLRDFWKGDRRMERTGPYTAEVYATKESRFWMSPAFRRRSVRVDMLWFKSGKTNPADTFYPQYWELLRPLAFRFHWGKHLSPPASSTGVGYRRAVLGEERWKRWMELRQRFDPDQIFVSDYWRGHLGIERKSSPT